ncbi:MAG TPA: hypothetical protein VMX38_07330 [Verrucomicrobiae bacterium]|nr:hypothetical protein [Verrucomicrobiae bacterium]
MTMEKSREFENFDRTMDELLKVSPDQIKADLEAEKRDKPERKAGRKPKDRNLTSQKEGID